MTDPAPPAPYGTPPRSRPRWRRRTAAGLWAAGAVLALTSPLWGPPLLRPLEFFRVRRVEIVGAKYLTPNEIVARLAIDTNAPIWDAPEPLERRVTRHPQVDSVSIGRKLPGTLVVRIVERLPVALVPSPEGLRPVDATGRPLPLDPTRVNVDLPILTGRDVPILGLLYNVRVREPGLFDRISEVRREGQRELLIRLTDGRRVRAMSDAGADRLADVVLVEADLARRGVRAAEIDLRFRDQVVAR